MSQPGTVSARARLAPDETLNKCRKMKTENLSYHEARAEEELALAETATTAGAVRAHVALAEMHLEILYQPAPARTGSTKNEG